MLVRELMSAPVVTTDVGAPLSVAVGRMLDHEVGSVVAVEEADEGVVPAGILTATDVLRESHARDRPLSDSAVEDAASRPLVTVESDRTVGHAVERMIDGEIKHLPVVDGLDVVGIVTLTDVAVRYDDIRDEAIDLVGRGDDWGSSGDE